MRNPKLLPFLLLLGCPTTPPGPTSCPEPNGETVEHRTNLSADETWAGDGTAHRVSGVTISSGTLTIEPCAIVELDGNQGLFATETGRIVAAGTADAPIVFRRSDPAVAWGTMYATGLEATLELRHALLEGGGDGGTQSMLRGGGDVASAGTIPQVLVDHVVLRGSMRSGFEFGANAGFAPGSTDLVVEGSAEDVGRIGADQLDTLPSLVASGNGRDVIAVVGDVYLGRDARLRADVEAAYVFPQGLVVVADSPGLLVTLTIDPGVTLGFDDGQGIYFGNSGSSAGEFPADLQAIGAPGAPITFTSTSGAGAGDWVGLTFALAPGSHLDQVVVENAGSASGLVSRNCRPLGSLDDAAIIVGTEPSTDMIGAVTIRASAGHGIDAAWEAASYGPDLTSQVTFDGVSGCRQTLNGVTATPCSMQGCLVD